MSRTLLLLSVVSVAGAIACSDQHPTAAPSGVRQLSAPASTPDFSRRESEAKPWNGRCNGDFVLSQTTLHITGVCHFARIGRMTFVIDQTLVFGSVIHFTGASTYTATNGDQLFTRHSGTATPTSDGTAVILAGTETAIGGTGRFAGATGSATLTGMSFLAGPRQNTGFFRLHGTLSFDRMDDEEGTT